MSDFGARAALVMVLRQIEDHIDDAVDRQAKSEGTDRYHDAVENHRCFGIARDIVLEVANDLGVQLPEST